MMEGKQQEVLVLGIGNRIMMDDGVGVLVVEELNKRKAPSLVRYAVGETDVDFCLEEMQHAKKLIIVDAGYFEEPCSVSAYSLTEILDEYSFGNTAHEANLLHAMKQYGIRKEGWLVTIGICRIDFCPELSQKMRERFQYICNEVERMIISFCHMFHG